MYEFERRHNKLKRERNLVKVLVERTTEEKKSRTKISFGLVDKTDRKRKQKKNISMAFRLEQNVSVYDLLTRNMHSNLITDAYTRFEIYEVECTMNSLVQQYSYSPVVAAIAAAAVAHSTFTSKQYIIVSV